MASLRRLAPCALALALLAAQPAPGIETFRSAGATLAYRTFGSGPDVIVLAGGPGLNAAYVIPLARIVASDGYRAIVLEQRGTGLSAAAAAGAGKAMLTERGSTADIEALRLALHDERVRFVTHSFGGAMALAYAAAHPGRMRSMVLVGSVGTDLSKVGRFAEILMTRLSPAERRAYAAASKRGDAAEALDIQLLAEFDDRAKARRTIATEPHPFVYPAISQAVYMTFARTYRVGPALANVKAPVLLLTGSDDAARAMEGSLMRALPNVSETYVSRSGHWPWIENPAVFDPALAAGLARE